MKMRTLAVSLAIGVSFPLTSQAQPAPRSEATETNRPPIIPFLEGTDVIYIAKVDSTHAVRMVSAAGRRLPAHCTSVGKMLLASLPESELTARVPDDAELVRMTPNSITEPAALREALTEIRARGIAVESRESNPDVSCVAAPVRDRTGQVVAALSISVPMIRWSDERRAELEQLAAKGAAELSERLGHRTVA